MAVGQVGFKNNKLVSLCFFISKLFHFNPAPIVPLPNRMAVDALQVKRIHVVARENPIINRLNKTKVEKFPDLREEKEARLRELRKRDQGARDARVSIPPLRLFSSLDFNTLCSSTDLLP